MISLPCSFCPAPAYNSITLEGETFYLCKESAEELLEMLRELRDNAKLLADAIAQSGERPHEHG